jgi:hypothetical protein
VAAADGDEAVAAGSGFSSVVAPAVSPGLVRQGLGYGVRERDLPEHGLAVVLLVVLEGPEAFFGDAVAVGVVVGMGWLGRELGHGVGPSFR